MSDNNIMLFANTDTQTLQLLDEGKLVVSYPMSTAQKGLGETLNSNKTPTGWHIIRAKIGAGAPKYTVFESRRPTGELYTPALGLIHPERDWILTRILWLSGLELGHNRLGNVDTMRRYIYIHACPDEIPLSRPMSHGCIRMHNDDVIDLFERVPVGTKLFIGATLKEIP